MNAYRIGGALTALLFAALLVWNIVAAFSGPRPMVVPTNGVRSGAQDDISSTLQPMSSLRERTEVQRLRGGDYSMSGGSEAASAIRASQETAAGQPIGTAAPPVAAGAEAKSWMADRDQVAPILDKRQRVEGITSVSGPVRDVFQQPEGRDWRSFHNNPMTYGGGIYILGITFLVALFLAWRGRVPIAEGYSGQTIERFSYFERANHWLTATSFLIMAVTGLIILYGRYLIQPWLGAQAFGDLSLASAWIHMAFVIPFIAGVIAMAIMWAWENLPSRLDIEWLKRFGGFLRNDGHNPPARRFNAGQKIVFWGVVLGAAGLLLSGLTLMFPFFWAGYGGMQWAQVIHAIIGLLMIGLIIGHIYIGTVGMEGAIDAMWGGQVDRNWLKEHHSLWYRELEGPEPPRPERRRPEAPDRHHPAPAE